MLFIKAFTSYFHIYRPPTPSAVASPIVRHHHLIAPTAQYITIGEKPPKSGLIWCHGVGLPTP